MRHPFFTPEQDSEVTAKYLAGRTLDDIGRDYGVSKGPVRQALRRQGVPTRNGGHVKVFEDTPQVRAQVVAQHRAGTSVRDLARTWHTRTPVISDLLRAEGVRLRPGGGAKGRKFQGEVARAIAEEYAAGASLKVLSVKYGSDTPTIRGTVSREGVQLRHMGREKFWTQERLDWMVREHHAGRSQQSIADELGIHQTAVSERLRALGATRPRLLRREDHGSWRGGRTVDSKGYVRVKVTDEDRAFCTPLGSGYVLEHRLVMGRALGRPLKRSESVHHINGDRQDNRYENLQLRHGAHGTGIVIVCLDCGSHKVGPVPLS